MNSIFRRSLMLMSLGISLNLISVNAAEAGGFVFRPPRRNPPSTAGAASRSGLCRGQREPLKVLAPKDQIGLTTANQAALLAYIPKTTARSIYLRLETQDRTQRLFEGVLPMPTTPGIVRLPLSDARTPSLKPNQLYRWTVALMCTNDRADQVAEEGWIEQVAPNAALFQALKKAKPERRPVIYAEAGIWHDTLLSLDAVRRPTTQWTTNWRSLLKSVGLEDVATAPRTIIRASSR